MTRATALVFALVAALLLSAPVAHAQQDRLVDHPHIEVVTTVGTFKIELVTKQAPQTVRHFMNLVKSGFYDGLIFHRVIPGFMVQTGGYTPGFDLREDDTKIVNESGNALSNRRGTIAMARTEDPHSANSQFFINVVDNDRLDPQKDPVRGRWGYTVFGYVFEGMDVVDAIAAAETAPQKNFPDAPVVPIVIEKMSEITYE
jgi:cyclophilin family peptidyl-prolyl cis-trans isomerase